MENIFDSPLFRGGNHETDERILGESQGRYSSYRKGDIIAMQGYPCRALYLLCAGSVYAKMISDEGREFTLDTLSAPDALASAFVFSSDRTFPVSIIASDDCGIWSVGRDTLYRLISEDNAVLENYLRIVSDHSMFLSRRLHEFALQSLSSRITGYIERNGPIENLQETAFILGVARPSLSRAIAQLVSQGILVRSGNSYDKAM